MISFSIIVAIDKNFGIGKNGTLPWHIFEDLRYFKEITSKSVNGGKNVVIMGRRTWESIPEEFRPLADRVNIVITSNPDLMLGQDVIRAENLDLAFDIAENIISQKRGDIFVIGGAQVFAEGITHPGCCKLYITRIDNDFDCDVFFPRDISGFRKVSEGQRTAEKGIAYCFEEYVRS